MLRFPLWVEKLFVLSKREIKDKLSYRMTFAFGVISGIMGLLVYGLLGESATVSTTSQTYGMSLAAYLVSGVAFSSIISSGPGMFNQYADPSRLEEVMTTPSGFCEYILLSSILNILSSIGTALLFFSVSVLLLGLSYSYNGPALLGVIALGIISSIGLGFAGLGLRLVYKQTSILSWLLFSVTGIVGNFLVPVQILPDSIRALSYLIPQYYFFTGIRIALGSNVAPALSLFATFALYCLVLLLTGLYVLRLGLRFVRRNGTHRWT